MRWTERGGNIFGREWVWERDPFPCRKGVSLPRSFFLRKEDPQTNPDQNHAAEDGGFVGKLCAEFFADVETAHTDEEGHNGDQERAYERFNGFVVGDGESNRERVDGGRHALNEDRAKGQLARAIGFFFLGGRLDALPKHLSANVAEKNESNPGNYLLECVEFFGNGVDADPAEQGHQRLKSGKDTGDHGHFGELHTTGGVQTVCKGDREGIHCQTHSQQDGSDKEFCVHFFTPFLLISVRFILHTVTILSYNSENVNIFLENYLQKLQFRV